MRMPPTWLIHSAETQTSTQHSHMYKLSTGLVHGIDKTKVYTIHSHMHKVSTWLIHGINNSKHSHNIRTCTSCLYCYQHSSTWLQSSHCREHSQHSHMYKLSPCLIHGVQKTNIHTELHTCSSYQLVCTWW